MSRRELVWLATQGAVLVGLAGFVALQVMDGGASSGEGPDLGSEPLLPEVSVVDGAIGSIVSDPDVGLLRFRAHLETNGLGSSQLTDDDILRFASTFCVFALGAPDRAGFDVLRDQAVAQTASELTEDQLDLTITAALAAFCPLEATRLGYTA